MGNAGSSSQGYGGWPSRATEIMVESSLIRGKYKLQANADTLVIRGILFRSVLQRNFIFKACK